jgi:predicted HicB family RNase H-like nuclease
MQKVIPFQVRLMEEVNRQIKIDAANKNLTKHEWIERAISEKLEREMAV